MSKSLFLEERRRKIVEQLQKEGRVFVKELSESLEVSAVTIRQDLKALEDERLLERTYGGAVLPRSNMMFYMPELSFETRNRTNEAEKEAIAREAVKYVHPGDSIAIDASSTSFRLVSHLKLLKRLVVVTNSLMVAMQFLDSPQIEVFVTGERLRRDSISLVGQPESLPDVNLKLGFFGAHVVDANAGVTESNQAEVAIKAALMEKCMACYVLADHTKWGKVAPYTLTQPGSHFSIITTTGAPPATVSHFVAHDTDVLITSVDD